MRRRVTGSLSIIAVTAALALQVPAMATAGPAACDPAALPLTVDGETYEVTRPDGNDVAAVGSFAWAVEQANAHPGVDEIVIASGVVVEGHAGIFPLVESALVRGADATAGFKGAGVEAGGPDQYFEFRDLHLETGLPDEASLPIIELNGACGGQLTRVTAVGIQGIAMRADSVRILKIEDSVFEDNAAPDGFSYGGVVVVDYMSGDPLLTVTGTRFTGNAGGAIKVLKPLMFSESGSADIGVRIAGSTFEGNMGYDWDTQYGAGTVSLAGMTVVGGNAQPLFSVHDTTFAGNSAAYTGGIRIGDLFDDSAASWDASVVSIQKSTFADNGVLVPDTGDVVGYDLVLGYMQPRAPLAPALSVNDSTFVNGNVEGDDVDGNGRVIASVAAPFVSGGVSLMHTTFIGSGLDLGYSFWGGIGRSKCRTPSSTAVSSTRSGPIRTPRRLRQRLRCLSASTHSRRSLLCSAEPLRVSSRQARRWRSAHLIGPSARRR